MTDDTRERDSLLVEIYPLAVAGDVQAALQRLELEKQSGWTPTPTPHSGSEATDNECDDAGGVASAGKRASPGSSFSDPDSEAADASAGAHKPRKMPKKSTYALRKEEKHELLKEMEALQERLKRLEEQQSSAGESLAASERENVLLRDSVRHQHLSVAATQSVVAGLLNGEHLNPLSTACIRLGTDWNERRRTLLAVKDRAIRHACEYVDARSKFLDPLKRHVSEERFENVRGDYCILRYETRQFTNVTSVKQVYDALLAHMFNIEISVSERLGDITTRDDFDSVEGSIASYRFLTSEFGVPVEKHGVMFMQYFESHELSNGEPCGVIVTDRVEDDELHPYTPLERMRKDSSLIMAITPHWRARADGQNSQELVVTLSMAKFIKLHQSECPLATPEKVELMRENTLGWGAVMLTSLNDILYRNGV